MTFSIKKSKYMTITPKKTLPCTQECIKALSNKQ